MSKPSHARPPGPSLRSVIGASVLVAQLITVSTASAQGGACAASPTSQADSIAFAVDSSVALDLLANDHHPIGAPVRIGATSLPGCAANGPCATTVSGVGSFELALDGLLRFLPAAGFAGDFSFTYRLVDDRGCTSSSATVSLSEGLDPFGYQSGGSSTGFTLGLTVVGSQAIDLGWSTVAGASSYALDRRTPQGTFQTLVTVPSSVSGHVDTGLMPDTSYCYQTRATTATGEVSSNEVCGTTLPAGDDGFVTDDALWTSQGERLLVDIAADLLANDVGAVSVVSFGPPSDGTLIEITPDVAVFAPPAAGGPFTFTYVATDGAGLTGQATVTVGTLPPSLPSALDDTLGASGQPPSTCFADALLLANDDGSSPTRIGDFVGPFRGTLSPEAGGYRYEHTGDGTGHDVLAYVIEETGGARDVATLLLEIGTGNQPPVAAPDRHLSAVSGGSIVTIPVSRVLANDTDPDCQTIAFDTVDATSTAGGSAEFDPLVSPPAIRYIAPPSAPDGFDTLGYTIRDPSGATARGEITFPITPPDAPFPAFTVTCSQDPNDRTCHFDGTASRTHLGNPVVPCNFGWDLGDGTVFDPNDPANPVCLPSFDHTYDAPGAYVARLTIFDRDTGVSASLEKLALPGIDGFQAALTVDCDAGLVCHFDGTESVIPPGQTPSFLWTLSNLNTDPLQFTTTAPTFTHAFAQSERWVATLRINLAGGGTSRSNRIQFDVEDLPPAASFVAHCPPQAPFGCTLDARDAADDHGIVDYAWTFGDGSPSTGGADAQVVHVFANGSWPVSLTVTDAFGQTDTATADVVVPRAVDPPPVARFVGGCSASPVNGSYPCLLDAGFSHDHEAPEALVYEWLITEPGAIGNDPGTNATADATAVRMTHTDTDPVFVFDLPQGEFDVFLVVRDGSGQVNQPAFSRRIGAGILNVSGDYPPHGAFWASCLPEGLGYRCHFDASASIDVPDGLPTRFLWDFGDGTNANVTTPIIEHTFAGAGAYTVSLVVEDSFPQQDVAYPRVLCLGCPDDPPPAARLVTLRCDDLVCRPEGAWAADVLGRVEGVAWRFTHTSSGTEVIAMGLEPGFVVLPSTGTWAVELHATDLVAQTTLATGVLDVSRRPIGVEDTSSAAKGQAQIIDVLANDSDPDGDALSIVGFTQPTHGSVTPTPLGRLRYQPDEGFTGDDRFVYVLSDGTNLVEVAVEITVIGLSMGL